MRLVSQGLRTGPGALWPMAKSAEDCALLLNAMAGFDARDSTSLERPGEDYTRDLEKPLAGLRIGLPREFFGAGMDDDVRVAVAPWRGTCISAWKSCGGRSALVASRASKPLIAPSSSAQSSALRAIGPAWSRLEA